jgi:hypothetical protein
VPCSTCATHCDGCHLFLTPQLKTAPGVSLRRHSSESRVAETLCVAAGLCVVCAAGQRQSSGKGKPGSGKGRVGSGKSHGLSSSSKKGPGSKGSQASAEPPPQESFYVYESVMPPEVSSNTRCARRMCWRVPTRLLHCAVTTQWAAACFCCSPDPAKAGGPVALIQHLQYCRARTSYVLCFMCVHAYRSSARMRSCGACCSRRLAAPSTWPTCRASGAATRTHAATQRPWHSGATGCWTRCAQGPTPHTAAATAPAASGGVVLVLFMAVCLSGSQRLTTERTRC